MEPNFRAVYFKVFVIVVGVAVAAVVIKWGKAAPRPTTPGRSVDAAAPNKQMESLTSNIQTLIDKSVVTNTKNRVIPLAEDRPGFQRDLIGKSISQIQKDYGSPSFLCRISWLNKELWAVNIGVDEATGLYLSFKDGKVYNAHVDEYNGYADCDTLYND
ncbi:MAG: hypothetical protein HYV42_05450 [Candidatus Magasanikbacteria bacterium]|nr:hypothetical protein [Candidatus Magasanikbacteria bacterium]